RKIIVRIDELKEADKGLLGSVENHPSLAHSIPDPIDMTATVISHSADWSAASVKLRYPKHKMKDAKVKDRVALGLFAKDKCICMTEVASDVAEAELAMWLDKWTCPER